MKFQICLFLILLAGISTVSSDDSHAKEICLDNIEINQHEICTTYEFTCAICYTDKYLTNCLHTCTTNQGEEECSIKCSQDNDGYCKKHYETCLKCYREWDQCTCPEGMTLYRANNGERKCVLEECKKGTYRSKESQCTTCHDCDPKCSICKYFPDSCSSCKENFCLYGDKCVDPQEYRCPNNGVKYYQTIADLCPVCIDKCPEGYYNDKETGSCKKCGYCCKNCLSATQCIQAAENCCLYKGQGVDPDFECPTGFKLVSSDGCFQCVACDNCPVKSWCNSENHTCDAKCEFPEFIYKHECIKFCPKVNDKETFLIYKAPAAANQCVKCNECPTSQYCDKDTYTCKDCDKKDHFIWNRMCLKICPEPYFKIVNKNTNQPQCQKVCPDGFFANKSTRQCEKCSDNCLKCVDQADKCVAPCKAPLVYKNNKCVTECGEGYYTTDFPAKQFKVCNPQEEGKTCQCGKCHAHCKVCNGPNKNSCIVCKEEGYYLYDGQCIKNCPTGFYPDKNEGVCNCCSSACKACTGPSINQCQACESEFVLIGNTCYKKKKEEEKKKVDELGTETFVVDLI